MVVQGTGAMAMVIADVPGARHGPDQAQAVATLAVLTGIGDAAGGLLKLGSLLRFVSNAVLVGFMNAVGVNIVLGQLANLTGYTAAGQPDRAHGQHHPLAFEHRLAERGDRALDHRATSSAASGRRWGR